MENKYFIYKLTSPSGRFYIGYTSRTVRQRWSNHVITSRRAIKHPLYAAIRKYGAENFKVETLAVYGDETEALCAEIDFIRDTKAQALGYNISHGGEDVSAAHRSFAALRKDPAFAKELDRRRKAAWADPKTKANHAAGLKAFWTPEAKARQAERMRRLHAKRSQESFVAAAAKTVEKRDKNPNWHKALKNAWADPEYKSKRLEKMRAIRATPEFKALEIEGKKRSWAADPERKAQQSERMKQYWALRRAAKATSGQCDAEAN